MKILVVCTANLQRSPTLEAMLNNTPGFEAKSAGTHPPPDRVKLTQALVQWADQIVVFEPEHRRIIKSRFWRDRHRLIIHCLDVPDDFLAFSPELIQILQDRWRERRGETLHLPLAEAATRFMEALKQQQGWTQQDFAKALGDLLEEES